MKIANNLLILCIAIGSVMFSPNVSAQNGNSTLTDPEIASIAVAANQIDIDFAQIAKARSKNKAVLGLAETMASDHQMVIDRAVELVTRLGVTPEDNTVSQQLSKDAEATKNRLNNVSLENFDKEYVDNEVAYHQKVIAALEDLLIPQASNKELKDLLEIVVPILKGHLEHAQMIRKKLYL